MTNSNRPGRRTDVLEWSFNVQIADARCIMVQYHRPTGRTHFQDTTKGVAGVLWLDPLLAHTELVERALQVEYFAGRFTPDHKRSLRLQTRIQGDIVDKETP